MIIKDNEREIENIVYIDVRVSYCSKVYSKKDKGYNDKIGIDIYRE